MQGAPQIAAERRQNVATANAVVLGMARMSHVAAEESFAALRLIAPSGSTTTAFSRGYNLSPLRGLTRSAKPLK